jgi:DNA-binding CsgD family transcriptional regulator
MRAARSQPFPSPSATRRPARAATVGTVGKESLRRRSGGPAAGESCPLTPRELELLSCAAAGLTAGETAERLGVARQTVKNTLGRTLRKLGAPDCTGAVVLALQRGWLSLDAITVAPKQVRGRAA